jgi:Asp-tRNA(Asn)/Glu-tRNA(Gln) amidotransferase A subunit family amidase
MTAVQAVNAIATGELTSEALVAALLAQIREREPVLQAWVHIDADAALAQARTRDKTLADGHAPGPLHGIPVGLKDIIDTADMPTTNGSDYYAGNMPARDATATRLLREAGAVIMGKTVTTEFALTGARGTTNPHDPKRTPGGSSSGSAAGVAAGMVPLALGSQTGGSMLRPASFCGVHAFKPSFGAISRAGVHIVSRRLDHLGIYARGIADLALAGDVLMVRDAADTETRCHAGRELVRALAEPLTAAPRLAVFRGEAWDFLEPGTEAAFEACIGRLAVDVAEADTAAADGAFAAHRTILHAGATANMGHYLDHADKLLPETVRRISAGIDIKAADYVAAIDRAAEVGRDLDRLFEDFDALLTPSAPGEAPVGLDGTGDPAFQKTWTLAGMPALNLPAMKGPNGMPIGLQVIGRRGRDQDLFRVAQWMEANGIYNN